MDRILNLKRKTPPLTTNDSGEGPSDNRHMCPPPLPSSPLAVFSIEVNSDEIPYDPADRKEYPNM